MSWVLQRIVTRDTGLTSARAVLEQDMIPMDRIKRRRRPRAECRALRSGPKVYFLFSGGNLVYIGKSMNAAARLLDHRMAFDSFATVTCSEVLLASIEAAYIKAYRPARNIKEERDTLAPRMKLGF